jgi:hypothetical protein
MKATLFGLAVALLAGTGYTGHASAGDTIFVANATTQSVTVYEPPYAAPPETIPVGTFADGKAPVALAFDAISKYLFVGAGRQVQIYAAPFNRGSKPFRILHEDGEVSGLALEHRFYAHGLLEVALWRGGIRAYSGRNGYTDAPVGQVAAVVATAMAFDARGHVFVAEGSSSDGSVLAFEALSGHTYIQPVRPFVLGPSALAFDASGNLWTGNYDLDSSGTAPGTAAFAPPFTGAPVHSIPDKGPGADDGARRLSFGPHGELIDLRISDVRVFDPPYGGVGTQVYACTSASGACDPYAMSLDSRGNLAVAVRSLSCDDGPGRVLLFAPPFTQRETPAATISTGIACPQAIVTAP